MRKEIWQEQIKIHPSFQPQDAVKLCYQAAFGAEHLLTDIEAAENWFVQEWEKVPDTEEPLYEQLTDRVCRINLGAWKREGLSGEWLWKMFLRSQYPRGDTAVFLSYLEQVASLAMQGSLPFSWEEWKSFKESYLQQEPHAVHHSSFYREQEHPAYRLVSAKMLSLIPVLKAIQQKTSGKEHVVIAIDGRCASGKTTLAKYLEDIAGASVIHMDDFFLPGQLRTQERLAQPGGNVHYERFREEVLPFLRKGQDFSYARFDCSRMELGEKRMISGEKWQIVEGTYSCHPEFGSYMNVRVFADVKPEEQLRRIERRNGKQAAETFRTRWIPMEERYFESFDIKGSADVSYCFSGE